MSEAYRPGVCNIDQSQRTRRLAFGAVFLGITAAAAWWLWRSPGLFREWRILLALPAYGGMLGVWQAALSFCVANAAKGQHQFGGKTERIASQTDISQDRRHAIAIHRYSIASALVLTVLLFFL